MEDRKKTIPENGGPFCRAGTCRTGNAGLDFEGPFRRSNDIVCSEVV